MAVSSRCRSRVFAADEVVSAFRHMQQAKHIGKIVIVPAKTGRSRDLAQRSE